MVKDTKGAVEKAETDVGKFMQRCQQKFAAIYE